ncbi:MAG: ABC-type transport auxiliary lipoprotein family protein [Desulfobacterales bacterium]|nr:ABC-type transport auxiliary lipoprotein family protein [Desulfobacterales bacterium]
MITAHGKLLSLLLILLLIIAACTSVKHPDPKISYYTFEYQLDVAPQPKLLDAVLKIDRFQTAPMYNSNRISFREQPFERGAYNYHKWRAYPGDLISHFLARDLNHSMLFKAVLTTDSRFTPTHIMEGSVDEFYEQSADGKCQAVLSVSVTLLAADEPDIAKRIIFHNRYRAIKDCATNTPQALAEAMSQAMASISQQVIADTYHYLS